MVRNFTVFVHRDEYQLRNSEWMSIEERHPLLLIERLEGLKQGEETVENVSREET